MIAAAISYQEKQALIEFPKLEAELNRILQSIGMTQKPEDIFPNCSDENACQVRLFADESIGQSMIRLVREDESLALLNSTIQALEDSDCPTMYDIIVGKCARSLRQINEQIRAKLPHKLQLSAIMDTSSKSMQTHPCIVEKVIPMTAKDFAQLLHTPENFKNLFQEYDALMYWDYHDVFHCILPYDAENGDGLLIDTEGHDKPEFYQFVPNAKLLIENYEAELKQAVDFSEEESLEISGISM